MTTFTKLIVVGAASLLSMAMAGSGVLPGDGALSTATASGHVQQASGVAPASAHPVLVRVQSIAAEQIRERAVVHDPVGAVAQIRERAVVQDPVGAVAQIRERAVVQDQDCALVQEQARAAVQDQARIMTR